MKKKDDKPFCVYAYSNGVTRFGHSVGVLVASTMARSKQQAINNLLYKFKTMNGYEAHAGGFALTADPEAFPMAPNGGMS